MTNELAPVIKATTTGFKNYSNTEVFLDKGAALTPAVSQQYLGNCHPDAEHLTDDDKDDTLSQILVVPRSDSGIPANSTDTHIVPTAPTPEVQATDTQTVAASIVINIIDETRTAVVSNPGSRYDVVVGTTNPCIS